MKSEPRFRWGLLYCYSLMVSISTEFVMLVIPSLRIVVVLSLIALTAISTVYYMDWSDILFSRITLNIFFICKTTSIPIYFNFLPLSVSLNDSSVMYLCFLHPFIRISVCVDVMRMVFSCLTSSFGVPSAAAVLHICCFFFYIYYIII